MQLVSNFSLNLCFLVLHLLNCSQLHYQDLTFTFDRTNLGLQKVFVFKAS